MTQQADQIREYIERAYRVVYINPSNGDIAFPYGTVDACWWMQVQVRGAEGHEWVDVSSRWPVHVPRERRAVMCELLQRIENHLILGKFEFDIDGDGEVRFCTTLRYGDASVEDEHVRHLVGSNFSTVREHLRDVLAVAYQGADPREVLRHEGETPAHDDLDGEFAALLEELGADLGAASSEDLDIDGQTANDAADDEDSGEPGEATGDDRAA